MKKTVKIVDPKGVVTEKEIEVKEHTSKPFDPTYLNLGGYLIIPLLLGTFLGRYLDQKFRTGHTITLIFIFVGLAGTIYNLYKIIKNA